MLNIIVISLFIFFTTSLNSFGICTKNKITNLYYGPHATKYKVKLPLFKNTPLHRLKNVKGWYKVRDFTSEEGWVQKKDLTSDFLCAIIKVNKTKLYPKIPTKKTMKKLQPEISYYSYTYKVLKSGPRNKWSNIESDLGKKYWVKRKHIWVQ